MYLQILNVYLSLSLYSFINREILQTYYPNSSTRYGLG